MWQKLTASYDRLSWWMVGLCTMRGRLNRTELLLRLLGLGAGVFVLLLVVAVVTSQHRSNLHWTLVALAHFEVTVVLFGGFWILLASVVRRIHDLGRTGRYGLIGVLLLPLLLVLPGEPGPNRYGPERTRRRARRRG